MAASAGPRPGWSRRAQYGLFFSFLAVLAGLIPVTMGLLVQLGIGVPVTAMSLMIRMLELFVSFLQAYIFMMLTIVYIAMGEEHH